MRRAFCRLVFLLLAIAFGLGASELLYRFPTGRALVARFFGQSVARDDGLRNAARNEPVADDAIQEESDLLRDQFGDENAFAKALAASGLTNESLHAQIADHLRGRAWLEKQIVPRLAVSAEKCRAFYEAHREHFRQPQRYRVSHLFLAAPAGIAPEAMAAKRSTIQGLGVRLLSGEKLPELVAEASEDEATKTKGGDLGYLSAARVPPEFIAEVEKLRVGQVSAPIQTHLGFHILSLTDAKAPREMSFEEAQPEIRIALANGKRAAAVAQLSEETRAAD